MGLVAIKRLVKASGKRGSQIRFRIPVYFQSVPDSVSRAIIL